MGKTTLLLHLLSQYRDSARTAFIFQTQCKRYELLRYLASELELPAMKHDEVSLHQRLKEMLVNEARAGRKVLIFIDEGQNLQRSSLEAIRLLSDFETARAKLLHIILAGSSKLGETLLAPELSQLAQRISTICRLEPFTTEEVNGYVTFRLGVAGCRIAASLFSPEALAEVAEKSEGIPRVINSVCYRALSLAYAMGERHVSGLLVRQAARELDLSHGPGAINLSIANRMPRMEEPHGLTSLPDLMVSEEKQTAHDARAASPELPEAATEEEMQFRSAAMSSLRNSVDQPPFTQPQGKANPEVHRKEEHETKTGGTKRNSSQRATILGAFSFKPENFKNDRSTLVLVALILVATVLWASWYELRGRSGARQGSQGGKAVAGSIENEGLASMLSNMLLLYSPTAISESTDANRKLTGSNRTHASIETLPQNLLPSKIHPEPANPDEAADPVIDANISRIPSKWTLPLLPGPKQLPVAPQVAMAESTRANQSTGEYQTTFPQPIKIVQPKYPKLAQVRRIEGDVLLELHLDSNGKVQMVRTLSGNSLLREAAEEASWQWQYPPFPENQPPTAVMRVQFNFKLNPETGR